MYNKNNSTYIDSINDSQSMLVYRLSLNESLVFLLYKHSYRDGADTD